MILGNKNFQQIVHTDNIIRVIVVLSFAVRIANFEEPGWSLQFNIFLVSLVLVTVFWESLRLANL